MVASRTSAHHWLIDRTPAWTRSPETDLVEVLMNVQQLSRRAVRAVVIGGAGLAIAVPAAGARPATETPIVTPASSYQGYQGTHYPVPPAQTQGVAPGELSPKLAGLAMQESAANAAARSAPAVQRPPSPAASDGSGWGTGALAGAGFAAMLALVSVTVVLSRRNRLPAAG
jgi:hypothetical protein